jgi:hypothetical protein
MTSYTKTTNFLAKDSLADSDTNKIIRGSEFDTEYNNLQTAVNSKANTISAAFTGTPTAPTAVAAVNNLQLATTAYVTTAVAANFTTGMIMLWSGSTSTIPSGWLICDGTSSTPDLRNRFIVGAGTTYAVDATGGSADAVNVSHTHTATVTDPGHTHVSVGNKASGAHAWQLPIDNQDDADHTTSSSTTGVTVANSTEGVSGTNANLPPYFALAYIMKT